MFRLLLILLTLRCTCFAQLASKELFPAHIYKVDLSSKKDAAINRRNDLSKKERPSIQETQELDSLLMLYDEDVESVWNIVGSACNWYCGGGNYKVNATSYLSEGVQQYKPEWANDLSYKTAWVVADSNGGIGNYIEYHFENQSPRITSIIVANGYMKSLKTWKDNNRVKKLKLYVNGIPQYILNLENARTDQAFSFSPLGHNADGSDLVLRFEIMEVYKGEKFNHTAITEIYFDGIDVH